VLYPPLNKSIVLRAESGDTQAQCGLGRLYRDIIKDYPQAAKWFRMAAEQWDPQGQVSLGRCYLLGRGVTQDSREAEKWFRAAAEQGDWTGQQRLGEFYARRDVHLGDEEAYFWLFLAAQSRKDKLSSSYYKIFAEHYESILGSVASRLSPQQRSEVERRALEWKPSQGSANGGRLL
jgi:TPR repeat protein